MTEFNYRELGIWQVFENNPSEENYEMVKEALQTRFERTEESMDSAARRILPRLRDCEDEEEEYHQNQLADPEIYNKMFDDSPGSDEQSSAGNDEVDESGRGRLTGLWPFLGEPQHMRIMKRCWMKLTVNTKKTKIMKDNMIMELNDVALHAKSRSNF